MALPAADLNKQPDNRTTMDLGAVLPVTAEVRDDHLFVGCVDMVALAREQGDIHRLLDAPFGITRPFTDPATQATWSRLKDEMRDWLARA